MPDRAVNANRACMSEGNGDDHPHSLTIVQDFPVSRERVWRAWTHPDALLRWYGPGFYPAAEFTAEVRVGGAWRACLKSANPDEIDLWQSGRYLVVDPPERLEFIFAWETAGHEDGAGVESHVVVIFEDPPSGGTRMRFSQTGFLSEKTRDSHSVGWTSSFGRLVDFISNYTG